MNNQKSQNVLAFPRIAHQPSPKLLENWKLWIAREVVEQWQKPLTKTKLNPAKAFWLKESEAFSIFKYKLECKIESEQKTCEEVEDIDFIKSKIDKYFYQELIDGVHQYLEDLKLKNVELIQKLVTEDCSEEQTRIWFDLCQVLNLRINKFQKQKNSCLEQGKSASQARRMLIGQLELNEPKSIYDRDYQDALKSIWRAIAMELELRLEAEIYGMCSQITFSLYTQCKNHHDFAQRSEALLNSIQKSLKEKCEIEVDSISIPIFTYLGKVDAFAQKQKLELWIGHSIRYWGNSPISWQVIEAKLLENVEEVAVNYFEDFQSNFVEDR